MRDRHPRRRVLLGFLLSGAVAGLIAQGGTYALFSDNDSVGRFTVGAGTWVSTAAPAECSHIVFDGDPIVGTEGPDLLVGTSGNDLIFALGGDDIVFGGTGDDCLVGGAGNDLLGGNGIPDFSHLSSGDEARSHWAPLADVFERGQDVLLGGEGSDGLYGGLGVDDLYGGPGHDVILGGLEMDRLYGGPGNDLLKGLFAGVVDGGTSLTVPDEEVDMCLFITSAAPYVSCERTNIFGLFSLDGSTSADLEGGPTAPALSAAPDLTESDAPGDTADEAAGDDEATTDEPGDGTEDTQADDSVTPEEDDSSLSTDVLPVYGTSSGEPLVGPSAPDPTITKPRVPEDGSMDDDTAETGDLG